MKGNIKLDNTDRKILEILQANSNITNAQLAKEIGLSPAPTLERVNKLETSGVIKSYHAVIDPACVGLGVSTFVMVTLKGHNKENIEKFIKAINMISEVIVQARTAAAWRLAPSACGNEAATTSLSCSPIAAAGVSARL